MLQQLNMIQSYQSITFVFCIDIEYVHVFHKHSFPCISGTSQLLHLHVSQECGGQQAHLFGLLWDVMSLVGSPII